MEPRRPEEPSWGQTAYEAYKGDFAPAEEQVYGYNPDWPMVGVLDKNHWEAAARAVLDRWRGQVQPPD